MKISRYCFNNVLSKPPLVFDALSRFEAEIGDELFVALKNRDFSIMGSPIIDELTEMGIIVPSKSNESKRLLEFLRSEIARKNRLDITYALTFSCNMKCEYCIQADTNKEDECDEQMFVDWVINLLNGYDKKNLRMTFFGGEPFLRRQSITFISSCINSFCEKNGITFKFSVTTNGTLVDKRTVLHWKKFGLCALDITLDGIKETHDNNRPYKNGEGTFEDICSNIEEVSSFVDVNLICNMRTNAESYDSFLIFLREQRKKLCFSSVRFKAAYEKEEPVSCAHEHRYVDTLLEVWKRAEEYDLPVEKDYIMGPCGFFDNNSWVVSPGGDIYPCTPFMGNKVFSTGNIRNTAVLDEKMDLLNNLPQECIECEYCPICSGGCRFVSLHKSGSIAKPTCEKHFFGKIFSSL